MGYLQARSDVRVMQGFRNDVIELWKIENRAAKKLSPGDMRHLSPYERQNIIQAKASKIEGYQGLRERVARGVLRANRIARRLDVPIECASFPMPAVGGPVIHLSAFDAIISDNSYDGVDQQRIIDALNQAVGECEAEVHAEFLHLINPLYWIKAALVFVIRIPFMLIELSGFDVSKVEDHFLARLFKLLEIVGIIVFLLWLGLSIEEIMQAIMTLFGR